MLSYIPLVLTALVTVSVIYVLYRQSEDVFRMRLREKISSVAATAAILFDQNELNKIWGPEDLNTSEFRSVTKKLLNIREQNPDAKFIYILRKTDDPNKLTFVADADMLKPIDWNNNGVIDEEEIPPDPGEEYDISDIPMMKEGFVHAAADENPIGDEWGLYLSGYAPIKDQKGKALAIVGMDVEVSDYYKNVRILMIPFVLLSVLLLLMLAAESISLIRIWNNRVELLKELDRQKDELIGIVAHQLGTPVTSVKWYIEMFLDGDIGKLTEEQQNQLKTMQLVTTNLSDLVSMILDVSRLQLGKMKVDRTDMNLGGFFAEILAIVEPKAAEKKVKFVKSLPKELPTAMLDKRLMRMTVENLLTNAVKYTPEGGEVELKVAVQGKMLRYTVRDTGCGIPKADQGRMFEKLFRASNVRKTDGNGFGLFVAKGAVEAQGGSIRFESTEGKGTTFFVELPLINQPSLLR